MKKVILGIAIVLSTVSFAQTTPTVTPTAPEVVKPAIVLQQGTQIKCVLMQDLNGKNLEKGETINFELSDNIIINDFVAVPKGAKITGTVTEADESHSLGKKGKLSFNIDYLYLASGKIVKLKGEITKKLGGSGVAVATTAILLSPAALLFAGKNAKYKKGEIFDAVIDKETTL